MTLDTLAVGETATITKVGGSGALRRRLLDMGLTPRTEVLVRKMAPLGDPMELCLRGYELTIRAEDAKNIEIARCGDCTNCPYHSGNGNAAHRGHDCAVREILHPEQQ